MVEGGAGTAAAPDELYTLRAQFALGHYKAALGEANQVARRPMSAALKQEREEYVRRAQMALHQYDLCAVAAPGEGPGTSCLCRMWKKAFFGGKLSRFYSKDLYLILDCSIFHSPSVS
jgi:Coatomer epsilon subunit